MTDLLDRPPTDSPHTERPRIDPRFAQRWVEARRQEGRRRLRALVAVAAVVAASAIGVGILYSPAFGVRHIRVSLTGTGPVTAAEVRSIAGLAGHRLMMDIDGSRIARRLDEDPWLADAGAQRRWPTTVTIEVVQREPLGQVEVKSGRRGVGSGPIWVEVDRTGRVLTDLPARAAHVPVLAGVGRAPAPGGWFVGSPGPAASPTGAYPTVDLNAPEDSPDVPRGIAAALAVLDSLPAAMRSQVASVSAGAGPGPGLVLELAVPGDVAPVSVTLGDGSQLGAKVASLVTLEARGGLAGVGAVDLVVPSRPATTPV